MDQETIGIVSGLPRSGTSMMMRMLQAGGLELLTDDVRTADRDNPRGYYEFERVKQIEHDRSWLDEARGKVVKMISQLLHGLPKDYRYKVVFMRREMDELLASQRKMLERRGQPVDRITDPRMAELFRNHLERVEAWLDRQPHFDVIYISYNRVLAGPLEQVKMIDGFFAEDLDVPAMANVVDRSLYRQRG